MMTRLVVEHHSSIESACDRFNDDISDWIAHCIQSYGDEPPTDVHDQGTYTTSWRSHIVRSGHVEALNFLKTIRNHISHHFHETGKWHHGYWKKAEAHHGTEHTELFLGNMYRLAEEDVDTRQMILDVAEHIGNWTPGIPDWFDWDAGLFRSMWQGTDEVPVDAGMETNVPDHLRLINISLLAYEVSEERRYLDFAVQALTPWAKAINSSEFLPVALSPQGPIYEMSGESHDRYRTFAGEAPPLDWHVDRAENFLASNGVGTFLTVWKHTGDEKYINAARKLIDIIITQIDDPDAGPASAIVRLYRNTTSDTRYDDQIMTAYDRLPTDVVNELSIDPTPDKQGRPSGIGKRSDMPRWYENGIRRRKNPLLLALAAEIADNEQTAIEAIDLARTGFNLARQVYPDGRAHGCSARSVSAIARGHGRDNDAGVITAVLDPVQQYFIDR